METATARHMNMTLNRVIKTTDANNNGTHFSYDASDRISTVTDALGNVRKYTYNAGGKGYRPYGFRRKDSIL